MRAFADEERTAAQARIAALEAELQAALLPKDPNDERNVFLEIRAGTGGDESALFAGDLLRMYVRYAERHRWQTEIVSASQSELGGYKEVIVRIVGQGAYSKLKFESGGHRVQRVPETEAQGRIHTSACTVAVIPEADPIADITINPADIRIDTFRASGAGGQHVNKTDSAVRITHLPTGLVVECQDDRSQHRNRAQAMSVLASRLLDRERQERQSKEAAHRKSLIGSGDRSERIRTYNFPQGRVTDHRINLTLYKIDAIMDGELDEVVDRARAGVPGRAARRAGGRDCSESCPAPWLETLRLAMREFVPDDFDDVYRLDSDPRVMKYITGKPAHARGDGSDHPARHALLPALSRSRRVVHGAPRHRHVHRLVLAQVRGQESRHRDRLPTAARRMGTGLRHRGRRPRCTTTASTISACIASSASRIPATARRRAC